jgi:TPR repeat protein
MGECYRDGDGVPKDLDKARDYFNKAFLRLDQDQATNGNASAQCSLGLDYLSGQGCETNREQAIYWLQKAAEQDNLEASNKLVSLQK